MRNLHLFLLFFILATLPFAAAAQTKKLETVPKEFGALTLEWDESKPGLCIPITQETYEEAAKKRSTIAAPAAFSRAKGQLHTLSTSILSNMGVTATGSSTYALGIYFQDAAGKATDLAPLHGSHVRLEIKRDGVATALHYRLQGTSRHTMSMLVLPEEMKSLEGATLTATLIMPTGAALTLRGV